MKTVGVLALQGDFIEHVRVLLSLKVAAREVRTPQNLQNLDGLIIPGGESTTIGKLMTEYGLIKPIQEMVKRGKPVWGTCAGAILIADHIYNRKEDVVDAQSDHAEFISASQKDSGHPSGILRARARMTTVYRWIGGMDITVIRNAFGRQVDSFEQPITIEGIKDSKTPFHAVFIRAPIIHKVGKNARILSRLPDGTIVAARQNNLLATSFHPELTGDLRVHEYFLNL